MSIFVPALVLTLHTLLVGAYLGYRRYAAVSRKEVPVSYYEAYVGEEPRELRVLSRHFRNLFEAPTLFYVLSIIAFATQLTGVLVLGLAWAYVLLRLVHSWVHLGPNVVLWRFRVFALSMLVLLAYLLVITAGLFWAP
jgi:hypothetical protein